MSTLPTLEELRDLKAFVKFVDNNGTILMGFFDSSNDDDERISALIKAGRGLSTAHNEYCNFAFKQSFTTVHTHGVPNAYRQNAFSQIHNFETIKMDMSKELFEVIGERITPSKTVYALATLTDYEEMFLRHLDDVAGKYLQAMKNDEVNTRYFTLLTVGLSQLYGNDWGMEQELIANAVWTNMSIKNSVVYVGEYTLQLGPPIRFL